MTWQDWILDGPTFARPYYEEVIDLSDVMDEYFPYGLLRVGNVRDEIDFNTGRAISNVERLTYSAENAAAAAASGRTWEADTNYIYLERASAVINNVDIDGQYAADDHGLEYFTGTDLAVYAIIIYGNNLKNKLERDVLTKSADVVNDLVSDDVDKALAANQGRVLLGMIPMRQFKKTTTSSKSIHINNLANSSQHFLFISGPGTTRFAILTVRVSAGGVVSVGECYKGDGVVSINTETVNRITVTFDSEGMDINITDLLMSGDAFAS
jgi:hypothetical protein